MFVLWNLNDFELKHNISKSILLYWSIVGSSLRLILLIRIYIELEWQVESCKSINKVPIFFLEKRSFQVKSLHFIFKKLLREDLMRSHFCNLILRNTLKWPHKVSFHQNNVTRRSLFIFCVMIEKTSLGLYSK